MRVLEDGPERLVLREAPKGLFGVFAFVGGGFLLGAVVALRAGEWPGALFLVVLPSLILVLGLRSSPVASTYTFDRTEGTLEVWHKYALTSDRRSTEPLDSITIVDIIETHSDEGRGLNLRIGFRDKEALYLASDSAGRDFPERVEQIRGFLGMEVRSRDRITG